MSTQRQPKGIPVGGQFAPSAHDEATLGLPDANEDAAVEVASRPLTLDELLDMQSEPWAFRAIDSDHFQVEAREYAEVGTPSKRIDQDRPSFIGDGERDFAVALGRIDRVWADAPTRRSRSESLIADMRVAGAAGSGSPSAKEAYARALVLNESGGYIDEEVVNHLLDHMDEGGTDYINQARSFGYHPEQYVSDLTSAHNAASYREERDGDDDAAVRYAAEFRRKTLGVIAADAVSRIDRGWSSLEEDQDDARRHIAALDEKLASATDSDDRIRLQAKRSAYDFALSKMEGRDR